MKKLFIPLFALLFASDQLQSISWTVVRNKGSETKPDEFVYFADVVEGYGPQQAGAKTLEVCTYDLRSRQRTRELVSAPRDCGQEGALQQRFCITCVAHRFDGLDDPCRVFLKIVDGHIRLYREDVACSECPLLETSGCCPHNPLANTPSQAKVFRDLKQFGRCKNCSFDSDGNKIAALFDSGAIVVIEDLWT